MSLAIENPHKLDLSPAVRQVLTKIFNGYRRVVIRAEFGHGLSGSRVLDVHPINAAGIPELPVVVKLATISLIQKEWQAYQQHIRYRLLSIAEIKTEQVLLPDLGWGGLCYTLMGGDTFEVRSFHDYCRRPEVTAEAVGRALSRLFRMMGSIWNYHQAASDFSFQAGYNHLLPVNLYLQHQPSLPDDQLQPVTAANPADASPGDLVRLSGFALTKINPASQTITLHAPAIGPPTPAYHIHCRSSLAETMAAHPVNDLVEPLTGRVLETRASRFQAEVRQALGEHFDLTQPTILLSGSEIRLPNVLIELPSLLNFTCPVNVASIHGDFNLENMLIEPETGVISLIDFAEAHTDHVLHDLLRLETEIITKLLPPLVHQRQLPLAPTLAYLYWKLHGTAFSSTPAPPDLPHPDLAKLWTMLTLIRQTARTYFFAPDDPGEYYRGLALYLLGALKFKNLNDLPEYPLPKQAAFWGAILAYYFLTTPPTNDTPPLDLAHLIGSLQPLVSPAPVVVPGASSADILTQAQAEQRLAALPLNAVPPLASLPSPSRMPLSRNPLFVGRQEDLIQLARTLKGGETLAIGQLEPTAATGLGGLGKTQLACEFVHRYGQYFAGGVFWLSFADPKAVPAEVAACGGAGALELRPDFGNLPLEEQVRLVLAAWQSPLPRLLVFDNCEDPALLAQWQPPSGGCRILITSRRADWPPAMGVTPLPLDVLNRPESITLLRKHYPDAGDAILDAIAAEVGDLPLALHLAGSYLARYRRTITPDQYLVQLRDVALLQHPSFRGNNFSPTRHVSDVYRTIALSYDQLDPANPVDGWAIRILARAACLAPGEPIPYPLLKLTFQLPEGDPAAALQAEDGINRLFELGLVWSEADQALRLHRLVVAFVQDVSGGEMTEAWEAVETAILAEARQVNEEGYPAPLLAWQGHLRIVTDAAKKREGGWGAKLCQELSRHLWQVGDYHGAKLYLEQAIIMDQKMLGRNHPEVALCLNNLGELLFLIGDIPGAQQCYEQALNIQEEVLGREHLDTAATLNNIGWFLQNIGNLTAARTYTEQALSIRQKSLGLVHPLIAETLSNLAYVHYIEGDLARARPYLEQALAIQQQTFGTEHPNTVLILEYLGELFHAQGDLTGAEAAFTQVLAIRRQTLGEEHPLTARLLNYLGAVRQDQGDLAQAQLYNEQALRIQLKILGETHHYVAYSLMNLAKLRRSQGELILARAYYERALSILEKQLGPENPNTAESLIYLGEVCQAQGDLASAHQYYHRAWQILNASFGPAHYKTNQVQTYLVALNIS